MLSMPFFFHTPHFLDRTQSESKILVSFHFVYAESSGLTVICKGTVAIDHPEKIEVLPSMTARGLKIYLAKLIRRCGLSQKSLLDLAASLEVRIVDSSDGTSLLVDMSDPQKDLGWLGISDGDTLQLSFF